MKKSINSLYILKAICAFFVVCIHVLFIGRNLIVPFIKTAVPCFYIITGYFIANYDNSIFHSKISSQIKKLFKIWLITNIVYLTVISLCKGFIDYQYDHWSFWVELLFFGNRIAPHLWYVTANIGAFIIILALKKKEIYDIHFKIGSCIIVILLLSSLLLGRYSFIFGVENNYNWSRNAINAALPFIWIGSYIRNKEQFLEKQKMSSLLILFFVFLSLSYLEYGIQYLYPQYSSNGDLNLFTIPLAICIFCICIKKKDVSNKILINIGKYDSLNIYLYHFLIVFLISRYATQFTESQSPLLPIITIIISLFISFSIRGIQFVENHFREKRN